LDRGNPINTDILHTWLFNEGSGQRAKDLAGSMHATLVGTLGIQISWTNTQLGASIDGSAGSAAFDVTTTSSVVGFSNPNVMSFQAIFIPTAVVGRFFLFSATDAASCFQFEFGNGNGTASLSAMFSGTFIATVANVLTVGKRCHLVYVRRGAGATHEIWIDGIQTTLGTSLTNSWADTAAVHRLGTRSAPAIFSGKYIKASIWNRALMPSEILRLYAEPFAGIETPSDIFYSMSTAEPPPPGGDTRILRPPSLTGVGSGGRLFHNPLN
jgi:hypothetical protein